MKIKKSDLQSALTTVKPGLARKELLSQATSFAFVNGRVVTYNDMISISHPVPGLDFTGAVVADDFYNFVSRMDVDDVDLSVNGGELVIRNGRARAGFTFQAELAMPMVGDPSRLNDWRALPSDFHTALAFTMTSCAKDFTVFANICVRKDGTVCSADNFGISIYTLSEELETNTFLINARAAAEVIKVTPLRVCEEVGWIHFANDEGTMISCRTVGEVYPNLLATVAAETTGEQLQLPEDLPRMLDRAMVFAERDHVLDESINVKVHDEVFTIEAESGTNWFRENADVKYAGDIGFVINPYLLKNIASQTKVCKVTASRLRFEGERWIYVAMLINRI